MLSILVLVASVIRAMLAIYGHTFWLQLQNGWLTGNADTKLFCQMSEERHCLHPVLSQQTPEVMYDFSLKLRTKLPYVLPHVDSTVQKFFCQQMFNYNGLII